VVLKKCINCFWFLIRVFPQFISRRVAFSIQFCTGEIRKINFSKRFQKNCIKFVQTASSAVFSQIYASMAWLFHKLFNITVENFLLKS